jgi:hypothetical protein
MTSLLGLGTKNHPPGEDHQLFNSQSKSNEWNLRKDNWRTHRSINCENGNWKMWLDSAALIWDPVTWWITSECRRQVCFEAPGGNIDSRVDSEVQMKNCYRERYTLPCFYSSQFGINSAPIWWTHQGSQRHVAAATRTALCGCAVYASGALNTSMDWFSDSSVYYLLGCDAEFWCFLVLCLAYFLTLKMESIFSSETSRLHNP